MNAYLLSPLQPVAAGAFSTIQAGQPLYAFNDYAGVTLQLACDYGANAGGVSFDLGADQLVDTILVFGVDLLPSGASLQVSYATSAQGPNGATFDGSGLPFAGSVPVAGKGVTLWQLPAPVVGRYFTLLYLAPAAGAAVRLSRVVIGRRVQLSRNFSYGASFGVKDLGSLDFSRRGVLLRTKGKKLRTAQITFSSIRKDEAEGAMKPLLEQLGNTEMFALVTDPAPDAQRQNRCYYGPLVGDIGLKWSSAAAWEASLNQLSIF